MNMSLQRCSSVFLRIGLGAALLLSAAGCTSEPTDVADTKTNWLKSCDTDAECGGLSCVCNLCTQTCESSDECTDLSANAECLSAAECSTQLCARPEMSPADDTASTTPEDAGGDDDDVSTSDDATLTDDRGTTDDGASPDSGGGSEDDAVDDDITADDVTEVTETSSDAMDAGSATLDGGGECPRPLDEYAQLGEACGLFDPIAECIYFSDECGCGCETLPEDCPRPAEEYDFLGTQCDLVDPAPDCDFFRDECGCGCEAPALLDGGSPECPRAEEEYSALGEACGLWDPGPDCEYFSDECGCGCEAVAVEECPVPPGTAVEATVFAASPGECFEPGVIGGTVKSEEEYAEQWSACGLSAPSSGVNFETTMLFFAAVTDRPVVELNYVVQEEGQITVGVEAPAYCGGARPPTGVLIVELPLSDLPVAQDTCFSGECEGPPRP